MQKETSVMRFFGKEGEMKGRILGRWRKESGKRGHIIVKVNGV